MPISFIVVPKQRSTSGIDPANGVRWLHATPNLSRSLADRFITGGKQTNASQSFFAVAQQSSPQVGTLFKNMKDSRQAGVGGSALSIEFACVRSATVQCAGTRRLSAGSVPL